MRTTNHKTKPEELIGRAKTVLVTGTDGIVTSIIARIANDQQPGAVTFTDPVAFDKNVKSHITSTILP